MQNAAIMVKAIIITKKVILVDLTDAEAAAATKYNKTFFFLN